MAKTFRDIGEGAIFKFAPSSDGFFQDHNTYIKASQRKYSNYNEYDSGEFEVGSIYAEILVIKEAKND